MSHKISVLANVFHILVNVLLGMILAYILAIVVDAPVADSISTGLLLMIALTLMDMRTDQVPQ